MARKPAPKSRSRTSRTSKASTGTPLLPGLTQQSMPSSDQLAATEGRALIDPNANIQGSQGSSSSGSGMSPGFDMYGITGLQRYGAISRIYEEFLKELQGPQGMKSLREMKDNCAITGAILYAAEHLSRKVTFRFKPANNSNEAQKWADFCGSCIFDDMDSTWPETLSEIITMMPFGWAPMEFRLKRRMGMGDINLGLPPIDLGIGGIGAPSPVHVPSRFKDGLIGFRSWELRSQETLFMWEFDADSNAYVMQQQAPPDYRIRRIPMAKVFLFRTQVNKGSPEGRSVLRNGWVSYYMKKNLQIFEGIGVERDLAGYPVIQIKEPDPSKGLLPPDIWNQNDAQMVTLLSALQKMVRNVRRDEQEGMIMPWWAEFSLMSTGSRRSFDTSQIIGRYDQRIAMSVMADFIMLGHEAVGSKALASTKISLFTSSLSSFLDTICAVVNRRAVPMLMQFNSAPQELAPTLEHGEVESVNLQELGMFIKSVAQTGFNPLDSVDAQRAILTAAHIPTSGVPATDAELADANAKKHKLAVRAAAELAGAKGKGKSQVGAGGKGDGDTAGDAELGDGDPPVMPSGSSTGPSQHLDIT